VLVIDNGDLPLFREAEQLRGRAAALITFAPVIRPR
jgi:hypothetical protein